MAKKFKSNDSTKEIEKVSSEKNENYKKMYEDQRKLNLILIIGLTFLFGYFLFFSPNEVVVNSNEIEEISDNEKIVNQNENEKVLDNYDKLGLNFPIINPIIDILIISFITSLYITLINKYFTDQRKMKRIKEETKELQKKIRKFMTKDPKKAQNLQKEMFSKNIESFKVMFSIKPMLLTMIPLGIIFYYVREIYMNFGEFLNLGFTTFGWFGSYFIFAIISSILLKKLLKVY